MTKQRDILITSALPYANGPIHLGHLVEHIQADIWQRFQKLQGHRCLFICGDDAHGTPIMIKAQQKNLTPEALINQMYEQHVQDFADFHIQFDNYYTTHSQENRDLVTYIYQQLKANDDIEVRPVEQAFDLEKNMFLPDRFVKGTCPRCHTPDQHGDNCEACGAHYSPTELINPISILSGTAPIRKTSDHYFFRLEKYTDFLKQWIHKGTLQPEVANKLDEWFQTGLEQWDISRDAPYFGFSIPDHPDKYFYVWLDAPVGYMASLKNLCQKHPELDFDHYWHVDSTTELYHFVGKDIIYFHGLFWPAMLKGAHFRTPTALFTHGFLTINGQKMSKSRGTFINARDFINHVNPECYRYYLAAKLSSSVEDVDFNFEDFVQRINADLVGKLINIASRCAGFINKRFDHQLADDLEDEALFKHFIQQGDRIAHYYETREYHRVIREIMTLADTANQYINEKQPWVLIKQESTRFQAQLVSTMALNLFRILILYLKPVIPQIAEKAEAFLNIPPLEWSHLERPLLNHTIQPFRPLLHRLELTQVEKMLQPTTDHEQTSTTNKR